MPVYKVREIPYERAEITVLGFLGNGLTDIGNNFNERRKWSFAMVCVKHDEDGCPIQRGEIPSPRDLLLVTPADSVMMSAFNSLEKWDVLSVKLFPQDASRYPEHKAALDVLNAFTLGTTGAPKFFHELRRNARAAAVSDLVCERPLRLPGAEEAQYFSSVRLRETGALSGPKIGKP